MGKRTVASVVVLFGIVSVVSAGAVMLFTQSLPTVNVQSPSVRADCLSLSSTPGTIVRGVGQDKSYVLFNCNGNKAIDFVASASPTPVFSLGVGYLNISLVIHSSSLPTTGPVCNPASIGAIPFLRSGVPPANVDNPYDYCVGYDLSLLSSSQNLGGFNVSWDQ